MSVIKISLALLLMVVATEATVLPLIKALFGKEYNLETDYYTQDDCIYPTGYNGYYSGYAGYPSGYTAYPSGYTGSPTGYYGYNGYGRGYYGYNGYGRGYNGYGRGYYNPRSYAGYNGYARGYGYNPRGYNGYDFYLRTDIPRQGKSWSELCKVHYPDSSGAPGKAGVVCL